MARLSVLATALLVPLVSAFCGQQWSQQRDDPAEYTHLGSVPVQTSPHCILEAAKAGASAAALSVGGVCSLLQCRLGQFGCRKCRNTRNSSLPQLWMRLLNGGSSFCWRTFQHRVDASVDFYRNWTEYVSGFGQGEDANFWLGLEPLHQLTRSSARRVRWEFSDWNGTWQWSENQNFSIGNASDKYRLSMGAVDSSRSTADQWNTGNHFSPHLRMFSTPDSDNDAFPTGSCAAEYQSGWWFGKCAFLNPNGRYYLPPTALDTSTASTRGVFFCPPALYPSGLFSSMKTFECLLEATF